MSGSAVGEQDATLDGTCLSFTVEGPWAHFRRIEGNIVKQTYRIIPRTTVAGLLAAVVGRNRDSYYDVFAPGVSRVAVEPVAPLRTMNLPQNTLSTAWEHLDGYNTRGNATIRLPDPTELRQQHNYEVLVEPAYRIDIQLASDSFRETLRERLEAGTSYYPPSLGLSEHLAEITYHGEFAVEPRIETDEARVDSAVVNAVDSVVPEQGRECRVERSPGYMTTDSGGRTTAGFVSYAFTSEAEPLTVTDVQTYIVDGRTVMFN
jgi:CRISPR-associated protein Cas5h